MPEVLVDKLTPTDDVADVRWTAWREAADGSQKVLGQSPSGIKVVLNAKLDGSWLLRAARSSRSLFGKPQRLLAVRDQVPGEQRGPGDDRLLGLALWEVTQYAEGRGFTSFLDGELALETHEQGEARRQQERARQDAERAERKAAQARAEAAERRRVRKAERVPAAEYVAGAVAEFGLTEDPFVAGFILEDGRMLDFGLDGVRIRDHREVGGAHPDALGGTEGLRIFQRVTGAVRLGVTPTQRNSAGQTYPPIVWIDSEVDDLTSAQLRRIEEIIDYVEPGHVEIIRRGGARHELSWPRDGRQVRDAARWWVSGGQANRSSSSLEPLQVTEAFVAAVRRGEIVDRGDGVEVDVMAAWADRTPGVPPVLDAGASRLVFAWSDEAVLKIPLNPTGIEDNLVEGRLWALPLPDSVRRHLVPVLDFDDEAGRWLLMERVRTRTDAWEEPFSAHAMYELERFGIKDHIDQNYAADGRMFDYGYVSNLRRRQLLGRMNVDFDAIHAGLQAEPRYSLEVSLARGPFRTLTTSATSADLLARLGAFSERVRQYDSVEALPLPWSRRRVKLPWSRTAETRSIAYLHAGHRTFRISRIPRR